MRLFLSLIVLLMAAPTYAMNCEFHMGFDPDSTSLIFKYDLDPGAVLLNLENEINRENPLAMGILINRGVQKNSSIWVSAMGCSETTRVCGGDRQKIVAKNGPNVLAAATASKENDIITLYVKEWDITVRCYKP